MIGPTNCLNEGLLFSKLPGLIAQVCTDRKPMRHNPIYVNLPRLAIFDQDILRLMSELSREGSSIYADVKC